MKQSASYAKRQQRNRELSDLRKESQWHATVSKGFAVANEPEPQYTGLRARLYAKSMAAQERNR